MHILIIIIIKARALYVVKVSHSCVDSNSGKLTYIQVKRSPVFCVTKPSNIHVGAL